MNITGATKEEMESGSTQLVNDLDKLYSLFAVYVKKKIFAMKEYVMMQH